MRNNCTILLVEDDKVDVMTVQRAFRDLNLTNPLAVAGNGEEALAYLRDPGNEHPCIILLDLNMPKMNGVATLRELRSRQVTTPVVLCSGYHEPDLVAGVEAPAMQPLVTLQKPYSLEALARALNEVLDR